MERLSSNPLARRKGWALKHASGLPAKAKKIKACIVKKKLYY